MIIHGWKFERKKKSGLFKKTKWKKNLEKNTLEQKQKEKNEERKKVEVQFELYCVKLVELMIFEKKKNCAPLVFRNTLCLIYIYIYLFFIVKPLTLVAPLQPY